MEIRCCKKRREPSELRGVPTENLPPYSGDSFKICFCSDFQLTPKGGLVIQADSISKVEKVLAIMDAARQIGITQVAIASEEN